MDKTTEGRGSAMDTRVTSETPWNALQAQTHVQRLKNSLGLPLAVYIGWKGQGYLRPELLLGLNLWRKGFGILNTRDNERWVKNAKLEESLDQDSPQNQEELLENLGKTQQAISNRFKAMAMAQKQGNSIPH